jgi:hypothetical protein
LEATKNHGKYRKIYEHLMEAIKNIENSRCRGCKKAMSIDYGLGFRGRMWRRRIREREWYTMCPGSRLLGGGSLRPDRNSVYDHSCVTKEPPQAGGVVF